MTTKTNKAISPEESARLQHNKLTLLAESDACMKAFYFLEMSVVRSDDSLLSQAAKRLGHELQSRALELKNKAGEI
ncbi:MAG: hypothetical protein CK426_09260 [Legionella sp.]|nr:MAG: hypothetical protein CK426_09260 [Legionella sp.]